MATIKFPTAVPTVDERAVEHYRTAKTPSPITGRRIRETGRTEDAVVFETTVEGMLATLAQFGAEKMEDPAWSGTATREQALTLAVRGWSEPVEDVIRTARHVRIAKMTSLVPQYVPSDEPAEGGVDVDLFLAGEELHFLKSSQTENEARGAGSVRLIMEPCVSAGVSGEAIVQRGAIVAALVWALERSGVKVSIEYRSLVRTGRGQNVHVYATIKGFGRPLDLPGIMFWLGHNSASRQAIFAFVYRAAGASKGDVGWSSYYPYGGESASLPLPPRAVAVPALHLRDLPTVQAWMSRVCQTAGVVFSGKR